MDFAPSGLITDFVSDNNQKSTFDNYFGTSNFMTELLDFSKVKEILKDVFKDFVLFVIFQTNVENTTLDN